MWSSNKKEKNGYQKFHLLIYLLDYLLLYFIIGIFLTGIVLLKALVTWYDLFEQRGFCRDNSGGSDEPTVTFKEKKESKKRRQSLYEISMLTLCRLLKLLYRLQNLITGLKNPNFSPYIINRYFPYSFMSK